MILHQIAPLILWAGRQPLSCLTGCPAGLCVSLSVSIGSAAAQATHLEVHLRSPLKGVLASLQDLGPLASANLYRTQVEA